MKRSKLMHLRDWMELPTDMTGNYPGLADSVGSAAVQRGWPDLDEVA